MPDPFDHPDLKKAVKLAWSGERAPRELRQRVAAACEPHPQVVAWPFRLLAQMAAIVIFGVLFLWSDTATPSEATLAVATAQPFVKTHDACCKLNDHHFVPVEFANQMAATGRWLSSQAHIPVLAVALDDGWDYCGAGPCPVDGIISGHLLFKRGKEDLSIFSVPAAEIHVDSVSKEYEADIDGHGLAAFTRNGGFYCVVGRDRSGYADIGSVVRNVRQSLIKDFKIDCFTAAGPAPVRRPALAVLLKD